MIVLTAKAGAGRVTLGELRDEWLRLATRLSILPDSA
jgi:hypothetical protein